MFEWVWLQIQLHVYSVHVYLYMCYVTFTSLFAYHSIIVPAQSLLLRPQTDEQPSHLKPVYTDMPEHGDLHHRIRVATGILVQAVLPYRGGFVLYYNYIKDAGGCIDTLCILYLYTSPYFSLFFSSSLLSSIFPSYTSFSSALLYLLPLSLPFLLNL